PLIAARYFFRQPAPPDSYTLSLHDALPICNLGTRSFFPKTNGVEDPAEVLAAFVSQHYGEQLPPSEIVIDRDIPDRELLEEALRSEEHTSELQSRENLVCRLLLEKKKKTKQ